jgi:hypothetical protein
MIHVWPRAHAPLAFLHRYLRLVWFLLAAALLLALAAQIRGLAL